MPGCVDIGLDAVMDQNGECLINILNTSVLTKMPRERTAPPTAWQVSVRWTFRLIHGASNTMNRPTLAQRRAQSARDKKKNSKAMKKTNNTIRVKRAPLAKSVSMVRTPVKANVANDRLDIKHKELVYPLYGDTTFSAQSIYINPGDPEVFSWGSQLALAYDYYIPHSVTIEVKPVVAATETGMIFAYIDSDTADEPPTDFVMASGNAHFKSASAWAGLIQTYPSSFLQSRKRFKVRRTALPDGVSRDDYDCGRIWFGSDGISADKLIGYVSLTYHFTLFNPTVAPTDTGKIILTREANQDVAADGLLDLRDYALTSVEGKVPVQLPSIGSRLADPSMKFLKDYTGQITCDREGLSGLTSGGRDFTLGEISALTFQQIMPEAVNVLTKANEATVKNRSSFYDDICSVDSFTGFFPMNGTMQPKLGGLPGLISDYVSGGTPNTLTYFFNAMRDIISY